MCVCGGGSRLWDFDVRALWLGVCVCGGGSRLWDFDVRALLDVCVWRGVTSVGL